MFKNITNRVKTYIVDKSEEIFQKCKCRKKFIRISYVLLILHSFSLISDIHWRLSSYLRIVDRSENAHLTVARFKGVQFQRPARIPILGAFYYQNFLSGGISNFQGHHCGHFRNEQHVLLISLWKYKLLILLMKPMRCQNDHAYNFYSVLHSKKGRKITKS